MNRNSTWWSRMSARTFAKYLKDNYRAPLCWGGAKLIPRNSQQRRNMKRLQIKFFNIKPLA